MVMNDQIENGRRLTEELRNIGFEVAVAFWANIDDEGKCYLYLVSPIADQRIQEAHRSFYTAIQNANELGIDPFEVRVIGQSDAMAKAAMELIRPKPAKGPFAVPNPRPSPGMTFFGGSSLRGVSVSGVYVYPSLMPVITV